VEAGGTLEVNNAKLNILNSSGAPGVLNLSNTSTLKISASDGTHGQITGGALNTAGVIKLVLEGDEEDFLSEGGVILDFNSFNIPTDRFESDWYNIELVQSEGVIKVLGEKDYEQVINEIAKEGRIELTGNQARAAVFIEDIVESGKNPELIAQLRDWVEDVAALVEEGDITPGELETAFNHLIGDPLLNASKASYVTAIKTQGVVFGRLDHIRSINSLTPPSAGGSNGELTRVWAGGFGTWSRQDTANGVTGYSYNNGGVALGVDHEFDTMPGLVVGISTAFSFGTMDVNDDRSTLDINTSGFGIYASYTTETGVFADASFNYGYSENKAEVHLLDNTYANGEFGVRTLQFAARVGKTFLTESSLTITPVIGVRVINYRQGGFTSKVEDGSAFPGNIYDTINDNIVELPLELRIQTELPLGNSIATPELRLGYTFVADRPKGSMSVGFDGSDERVELLTSTPATGSFNAGVGFKVDTLGALDFFANYDLNIANDYRAHQLSAGLGYQF
jgi:outer membrane autotransporter protein